MRRAGFRRVIGPRLLARLKIVLGGVLAATLVAGCGPAGEEQPARAAPGASSGIEATFRVYSPDLTEDATVWLAGDVEELGAWRPDGVRMDYVGDQVWAATVELPRPMSVEYKYTLGSWEREGAQATGFPLPNFAALLEDGQVVEDRVLFWTDGPRSFEIRGQVTGDLRRHEGLVAEGLLPRDALVWLPPDYEANPARRYPVIYLQDGQNVFDPATSSYGVDWGVDESLDRLIREGAIEPMIAVALTSTDNRSAEYSPGPAGEAYLRFLVEQVRPMIDAEYRTLTGPEHTLVGGSSMGGLVSCMLGWRYPEVFGAALCFSPAFRIDDRGDWLPFFIADPAAPDERPFLYLDNGGIGLEQRLQPGIDAMLDFLDGEGWTRGEDYVFVLDPEARHFESAWAERFPEALLTALAALDGESP